MKQQVYEEALKRIVEIVDARETLMVTLPPGREVASARAETLRTVRHIASAAMRGTSPHVWHQ